MITYDRIVETAMRLRSSDAQLWEEHVMAVREFAAQTASEMLRVEQEMLPRAQGFALCANELATTLMKAPKLHEALQRRHQDANRERRANA